MGATEVIRATAGSTRRPSAATTAEQPRPTAGAVGFSSRRSPRGASECAGRRSEAISSVRSPSLARPGEITLCARARTRACLQRVNGGRWSRLHPRRPYRAQHRISVTMPVECRLAACSSEASRIDLLARSSDGACCVRIVSGETWATSSASARRDDHRRARRAARARDRAGGVPRTGDRIDVLALDKPASCCIHVGDGSKWSGFESLGLPTLQLGHGQRSVPLSGPLAHALLAAPPQHVRPRRPRDLMMKQWEGAAWSEFVSLGGRGTRRYLSRHRRSHTLTDRRRPAAGAPIASTSSRAARAARCSTSGGRGGSGASSSPWACPVSGDAEPETAGVHEKRGDQPPARGERSASTCSLARSTEAFYHAWWDGRWSHHD